jgi:hypothetical protein
MRRSKMFTPRTGRTRVSTVGFIDGIPVSPD